ncbi:MAG: FAD-dependent oxidoreductase [Anaerolineae bacterium]|nr:FAD-dependent oxidoreductase [Anaerolineae bacterium]
MKQNTEVLIIGGGIIGVCTAYFLARQGREVCLIERDEIGGSCSYGNAGLIVPSHSIPLAAPGVLTQGLKWLLDAESPFYIKPRLEPRLLTWLWRFQAACRVEPMRRAIPVLRDLLMISANHYETLVAEEKLDCNYEQQGMLFLFQSGRGFEEGIEEAKLLREYGVESAILDYAGVRALEPAAQPDVVGGLVFHREAHLNPAHFVRELAGRLDAYAVTLQPQTEVLDFETTDNRVTTVKTNQGDIKAEQVVLAAGSWSPQLARKLAIDIPLQPAKGYSLTVKRPPVCPRRPLMLAEAKVAVTPFTDALRLAGTLELAGLDLSINPRRVGAIRRAAGVYLQGMEELDVIETWAGLRPCTPDGLPVIGRVPSLDNLIIATGHAMLGISLGPVTGDVVSRIVLGTNGDPHREALSLARF